MEQGKTWRDAAAEHGCSLGAVQRWAKRKQKMTVAADRRHTPVADTWQPAETRQKTPHEQFLAGNWGEPEVMILPWRDYIGDGGAFTNDEGVPCYFECWRPIGELPPPAPRVEEPAAPEEV